MKTLARLAAITLFSISATACVSDVGNLDDGGRAMQDFVDAPVHDNDLVGRSADTVEVVKESVDTPFDGD